MLEQFPWGYKARKDHALLVLVPGLYNIKTESLSFYFYLRATFSCFFHYLKILDIGHCELYIAECYILLYCLSMAILKFLSDLFSLF